MRTSPRSGCFSLTLKIGLQGLLVVLHREIAVPDVLSDKVQIRVLGQDRFIGGDRFRVFFFVVKRVAFLEILQHIRLDDHALHFFQTDLDLGDFDTHLEDHPVAELLGDVSGLLEIEAPHPPRRKRAFHFPSLSVTGDGVTDVSASLKYAVTVTPSMGSPVSSSRTTPTHFGLPPDLGHEQGRGEKDQEDR